MSSRHARNEFDGLLFADDESVARSVDWFRGEPIGDRWVPLRIYWQAPEFPVGPDTSTDFPGLQGIPVFTSRAADALYDLVDARGELLPLDVEGGDELFAFNTTRLCDALDEESSELAYSRSGRLMAVDRFAFHAERLQGETIFRLRQLPEGWDYITGAFTGRVESARLRGLDMDRRVWAGPEGAGMPS